MQLGWDGTLVILTTSQRHLIDLCKNKVDNNVEGSLTVERVMKYWKILDFTLKILVFLLPLSYKFLFDCVNLDPIVDV